MNPVRAATVIDFMEWVRRYKSYVRALCNLEKNEFMELVVEYETSKGVRTISDPRSDLYRKWESAQWMFKNSNSDAEALQRWR